MLKKYFKDNYNEIINTLVTIIIAFLTNQGIDSSNLIQYINDNVVNKNHIAIWLIKVIIVFVLSLLVNYCIKRFETNTLRRNIRYRKNTSLKNIERIEKQNNIDEMIVLIINSYCSLNDMIINDTNALYSFKKHLMDLDVLSAKICNLVNNKEIFVSKKDEYLVHNKFSLNDIDYYLNFLSEQICFINNIYENINQDKLNKEYQKKEIIYIKGLIDTIKKNKKYIENINK